MMLTMKVFEKEILKIDNKNLSKHLYENIFPRIHVI